MYGRPTHYDLLGTTAIIDLKNEKDGGMGLARRILGENPRIRTVLAKAGPVSGVYRTRKLKYLLGEKRYIVEYKENGCAFVFDPRRAFFSPRLSFERSRIIRLVRDGERVIVMFAGVGPFAITIAKAHKNAEVVGIEKNPYACRRMVDSIKLNRTANVKAVQGDVKRVSRKYAGFADRIIMPLPWSSLEFLDSVVEVAKPRATVHLYVFGATDTVLRDSWKLITEHMKKRGCTARRLFSRIVRPYSARESEIVIDFAIRKAES